ncbi:serine--tRNA ligase [archaeon]|nr:MAG: serine--tRNA ligase [archaeon]
MLDIKLIRENPDLVRNNLKRRNNPEKIKMLDELIAVDKEWRGNVSEANDLRKRRNDVSKDIAAMKKEGKDITGVVKEAAELPKKIKELEELMTQQDERIKYLLLKIPNLLDDSVPVGKDETENVQLRVVGKKPKFMFEPKNHLEIAQNLGLIDEERAAKVAGRGFFYLKGDLARLDMAIQRYALDVLAKQGFTIIEPPLMLREEIFKLVTDWDTFTTQAYKIEGEDLRLIGTAEHPVAAMYKDEVLQKDDMPILVAGVSPCFREEVGAHGKYTKGLFRMHHFNKVEQFVFCSPEDSWKWHEKLQANSEKLIKGLGLHYRVVNVCTGDIGDLAAKKYDTEIWMADGNFREVGSNSNCTDYQARRLNIKYTEKAGAPPEGFVHTLNNTGLATSRVMIAILEQFQQKNGHVKIPKVLVPYMGVKSL